MAYFKEFTDTDGEPIIVNFDHINSMKPTTNGTTLTLTNGSVIVKETPDMIVSKGEFQGMLAPPKPGIPPS